MATGYPITRTDLDNRMGAMVVNVRASLLAVVQFKTNWLDDATLGTDAFLQSLTPPYTGSVSSGEIQTIRAAFADLKKLSDIANGTATQGAPNDFWFNAKHLVGLNV